jgi:uracil-DNA glycosylase
MDSKQIDLLQSVHSLLLYHNVIGIDNYPAADATIGFLRALDISVETSINSKEGTQTGTVPVAGFKQALTTGTCGDIADEIRSCTSCSLHIQRLLPVPGHGGVNPRLLIVGGWLTGEEGIEIPEESIFGLEEDNMVSRMLSAMMLPPEKAFITNIIKCAIPDTCQPDTENISTCFSFLRRQIIALAPEIICTMGLVATKALLKNSQPLSQLRGKFYPFALSDQKNIPVIPTYHPTFLLRNPELKRATWEDLQSIAKQMKILNR